MLKLTRDIVADPPPGAWYRRTSNGFVAGATSFSLNVLWFPGLGAGLGIHLIATDSRTKLGIVAGVVIFLLFFARCWQLLLGRITIERDGDTLKLSSGFRPFERSSVYSWATFAQVYEKFEDGGETLDQAYIVLEGSTRILFGEDLSEVRRAFLLEVLRRELRDLN